MSLTDSQQQRLRQLLEHGLPLHPQPWLQLARRLAADEADVLDQARQWQREGLFRRFGLVVRHRALGYCANVMLVLDIPDHQVESIGEALARAPGVNLCYRRPRRPHWPYNLFCMIHGREREWVIRQVQDLLQSLGLEQFDHHLLFSRKAYKQRGGHFVAKEACR